MNTKLKLVSVEESKENVYLKVGKFCLFCGKPLPAKCIRYKTRNDKLFCNVNCRVKYHYNNDQFWFRKRIIRADIKLTIKKDRRAIRLYVQRGESLVIKFGKEYEELWQLCDELEKQRERATKAALGMDKLCQ